MALLLASTMHDPAVWLPLLRAELPDVEVRTLADMGDAGDIEVALAYRAPPGLLARLPNLRAIIGPYAGVDDLVADPDLPQVPITRTVDPLMVRDIGHHVVLQVLGFYRDMLRIQTNQRAGRWEYVPPPPPDFTVGVMGVGAMGGTAARMLRGLGFDVCGWSRSSRTLEGVAMHVGAGGLAPFLANAHVLVAALPLTPDTDGILNVRTLSQLPRGAFVVNIGRGGHLVEADLLALLDAGHLGGAALDVLREEPPPADHPFWDHPRIVLTPHSAGRSRPESVAPQIAENVRRALAGRPLLNPVNVAAGY